MAASCRPSARTGPMAAIIFSVHTMKGMAAEHTQQGGCLMASKWLLWGSMLCPSVSRISVFQRACQSVGCERRRLVDGIRTDSWPAMDKYILAVIVLGSFRNGTKFHSRHRVAFDE